MGKETALFGWSSRGHRSIEKLKYTEKLPTGDNMQTAWTSGQNTRPEIQKPNPMPDEEQLKACE